MLKDYIYLAKTIINEHSLDKYIDLLLNFWDQNPTTLGHGFSHVLKVAVESYEIAKLNNYNESSYLFIGGLFHDVIRPAEDKAGEEDQTAGAKVVEQIFEKNNIEQKVKQLISGAILSHDNWIGEKDPHQFELILSTGDKASHDVSMSYGYAWASNKYCIENQKELMFKNHFQTLYLFNKYQQRAWSLFAKNPINGTERAIEAYLEIYMVTAQNYLNDSRGDQFNSYIETLAENTRKEEIRYLESFGKNKDSIKKLLTKFY